MSRPTFPPSSENAIYAEYADLSPLQARITAHLLFSEVPDNPDKAVRDLLAIPSSRSLLDVGCGTGAFLHTLAQDGHAGELVGMDASPDAVRVTDAGEGVTAAEAYAEDLPFADETFDCVTARHMLYHVPAPNRALAEARRVLRPGGRFVATVNHREVVPRTLELVREVVQDAGFSTDVALTNDVHSDSLPPLMREVFGDVESERFDNALVFPAAEPLASFAAALLSFCGIAPDSSAKDILVTELNDRCHRWFADHPASVWRDPKGYTMCSSVKLAD